MCHYFIVAYIWLYSTCYLFKQIITSNATYYSLNLTNSSKFIIVSLIILLLDFHTHTLRM